MADIKPHHKQTLNAKLLLNVDLLAANFGKINDEIIGVRLNKGLIKIRDAKILAITFGSKKIAATTRED